MKKNVKKFIKKLSALNSPLSTPLGFTFIELILVVSMILILGTMGTAFGARFITQNGVINATDQLVNDFRKAQINSMMGKNQSHWGINYASNTITLYRGNSFAARVAAVDETFSVPAGVNIAGLTDINFWPKDGTPSATASITISGSGESRQVSINAQGMVTR